jgi:putative FmdB family regulatory protein
MPIYQYACQSCGHSLEALQKISDEPLKLCPNCNKPELAKQLTAAAFRLKGTGWYETDFKNSGKKQDSKADSPDKKPGDSGEKPATSSSDTKSSGTDSGTSAASS